MSSTNPSARPPKAPQLTSMPSTPGPELPGSYPRNSVVFATNQWDNSAQKGKPGLLSATKAYLPPAVASLLPSSTDSPLHRASSVGHTPGVALHTPAGNGAATDSDSSTSMPTPGELPTPGGRTFAARASSHLNSSTTATADTERDYFCAAAALGVSENQDSNELADVTEEPAVEHERGTQLFDTGAVSPSSSSPPEVAPVPSAASPPSTTSPASASTFSPSTSTSTPNSSGTGSTPRTAATTPSSLPSISSPKSLKYAPTTLPSRPSVTKAGSAAGFGATVRRFASVRSRRRQQEEADRMKGGEGEKGPARGVSLDSSQAAGAVVEKDTSARATSPISSSSPPSAAANVKTSRRVSFMRALRGEAANLAGRVRGTRGTRASASS